MIKYLYKDFNTTYLVKKQNTSFAALTQLRYPMISLIIIGLQASPKFQSISFTLMNLVFLLNFLRNKKAIKNWKKLTCLVLENITFVAYGACCWLYCYESNKGRNWVMIFEKLIFCLLILTMGVQSVVMLFELFVNMLCKKRDRSEEFIDGFFVYESNENVTNKTKTKTKMKKIEFQKKKIVYQRKFQTMRRKVNVKDAIRKRRVESFKKNLKKLNSKKIKTQLNRKVRD